MEGELNKAIELSDNLDEFGPGKLFKMPVVDGYAWYVVTKTTKTYCWIEIRHFCLDNYQDYYLQSGGKFNRKRIEDLVESQGRMEKLFKG